MARSLTRWSSMEAYVEAYVQASRPLGTRRSGHKYQMVLQVKVVFHLGGLCACMWNSWDLEKRSWMAGRWSFKSRRSSMEAYVHALGMQPKFRRSKNGGNLRSFVAEGSGGHCPPAAKEFWLSLTKLWCLYRGHNYYFVQLIVFVLHTKILGKEKLKIAFK